MHQPRKGYIIPFTLMLISVAVMLIMIIYQRGSLFVPYISTMHKREQAKLLALSGIELARSQLSHVMAQEKKEESSAQPSAEKKDKPETDAQWLFGVLVPTLNRWQEFRLQKETDGIKGKIQIAIAAEAGKININRIYDFNNHKFVGQGAKDGKDWQAIMKLLFTKIKKELGISGNLYEQFEKFLKERQYKLNDATELLILDAFRPFDGAVFYEPPEQLKRSIYLLDIFTVYNEKDTLQPWLLSDSLLALLGLKRATNKDAKQRKEMVVKQMNTFKQSAQWAQDWDTAIKPFYGVEFKSLLKGIDTVLESAFDPKMFSVVSYGEVGNVTQRVYAILERVSQQDKNKTYYSVNVKNFIGYKKGLS
jgi:General secretion pathway protein K.